MTQPFLLQQLGNPNAGPRDRETLLAVLNFANQPEPVANAIPPQIASPNIIAQHQQQNPGSNPIQHQAGAPISHDLLQSQHLFLQHQANVTAQKQQLRISPLPNGTHKIIKKNLIYPSSELELKNHTKNNHNKISMVLDEISMLHLTLIEKHNTGAKMFVVVFI